MQIEILTDGLLALAGFMAAFYCHILARRLQRFTALEDGMGGAIAVLSAQVDEMTQAAQNTQTIVAESEQKLTARIAQAEALCKRLELLTAAFHDVDPEAAKSAPEAYRGQATRVMRRRKSERGDYDPDPRSLRDWIEAAE